MRQKLPSLKHDFYIILACDPGRGAGDFENGGVLTQEVLRLLPYRKPILQIFHEVEKRVKCQRPWVRSRAGDDEPVLGQRDEEFPSRSPRHLPETAQLLGVEDDMYGPHTAQSPPCPDSDSLSACDTFRLYWFPFAGILALGIHAILLTLWVSGVGINKRYATRLAMPPCLAFMDLASLSQAYYRRLSELKPSCGLACSVFLHQVWPKWEHHLNRVWYPSLFLVLAAGELTHDRDVLAAIVSCILGAVCYFTMFRFKLPAILTVYDRFDETSIDRATWTWLSVSAVALYFAESGYQCLQASDDDSMRNVERNFHVFNVVYLAAWYFTMFHRANPAFADCGLKNSLSRNLSAHMTIVPLVAILCPLTQSVLRASPIWNSWPWQLWLLAEYAGLFGFATMCGVVFPRCTTPASDDIGFCA
ncbi:unnamed protein product [Symbiodinium sp. CCMP2592]|nr:unnamed protein product [Symbiodinium sp. CCMP2592]